MSLIRAHSSLSYICQVYFGAADLVLDRKDVRYPMEADAEILGLGGVTAFLIITPMLLLAYAIEGRKSIQVKRPDFIQCRESLGNP